MCATLVCRLRNSLWSWATASTAASGVHGPLVSKLIVPGLRVVAGPPRSAAGGRSPGAGEEPVEECVAHRQHAEGLADILREHGEHRDTRPAWRAALAKPRRSFQSSL